MGSAYGFREHAHTADWELEVWAPDLPGLLEQAALGMYALSGVKLEADNAYTRSIRLKGMDPESLLVQFLSELVWLEQDDGIGFNQFDIVIEAQNELRAELQGGRIISMDKEIKAVTYHNLRISHDSQGLHVTIVFDV